MYTYICLYVHLPVRFFDVYANENWKAIRASVIASYRCTKIYMCVYVQYTCIYVCIYVHMYTCMYIYLYMCGHTHR